MWLLSALWSLFWLWPFGWLAIYGCLHALGTLLRASKKPIAALVGLGFLLFCIGWLYKRRADVSRGLLVVVVGGVVAVWLLAAWKVPHYRFTLFAPVAAVACIVIGFPEWGWLDTHVGDRSLMDVINDLIEGNYNRAAVAAGYPDVTVGKARRVPDGFEYHTHANGDPNTVLDPAAIGGRVNRGKSTARDVQVIPHSELGTATVRILSTAPPAILTPWQMIANIGVVTWPGPSTVEADAPVVLGFDVHGRPMSAVGPAPNAICHAAIVGAQRRGKSATMAAVAAEFAFRPGVAIIMLDPQGVEFSPWKQRATAVISGVPACRRALPEILAWAQRRAEAVTALGRRTAPLGKSWPGWYRVVIFVDEVAAIADVRGVVDQVVKRQAALAMAALTQLSEQMGKFGIQLWLATQRPEVGIFEGRLRDNLHTRVGHRHLSGDASRMTAGTEGPDLTSIPLELQGAYYLSSGDVWSPGRSLLLAPHGPVPDDEESEAIAYAAAEVAAATAHLRVPWERLAA